MDKNFIKEIIITAQSRVTNVKFIDRKYTFERELNYVIVGLRRAGKTYLLYQYIRQLLQSGVNKEQILFVNFEDERISDMQKEDLHLLIDAYSELYDHEPYIFLDEIQNVDGWEHFVRRLADEKRRVVVTGSNAHMLSREIATTLGGRFMIKEVFPFSFEEYLDYHNVGLDKHWRLGRQRNDVVRLFNDYFYWGGMAECFPIEDKRAWLTALYQRVLYSDIVVRNNLRNEQGLNLLVKKLADSVLQPASVKRLCDILRSTGQNVTRETVSAMLGYLHDAYITFSLPNFTDGVSERESIKKSYFYDNGLLNLFLFQPEPKLLENMVAIAMYKHFGGQLNYYRRNVEVDFVVPERKIAVQACYDMSDTSSRGREISALVALNKFIPCDRNIIVTMNDRDVISEKGVEIEVVPVWDFLLQDFRT